jgi:hypothetical protein
MQTHHQAINHSYSYSCVLALPPSISPRTPLTPSPPLIFPTTSLATSHEPPLKTAYTASSAAASSPSPRSYPVNSPPAPRKPGGTETAPAAAASDEPDFAFANCPCNLFRVALSSAIRSAAAIASRSSLVVEYVHSVGGLRVVQAVQGVRRSHWSD